MLLLERVTRQPLPLVLRVGWSSHADHEVRSSAS